MASTVTYFETVGCTLLGVDREPQVLWQLLDNVTKQRYREKFNFLRCLTEAYKKIAVVSRKQREVYLY
jgi:hypothetical protein